MHWSGETSEALRTLMLNREWQQYWEQPKDAAAQLAAAA
jgi:hypothetical protein